MHNTILIPLFVSSLLKISFLRQQGCFKHWGLSAWWYLSCTLRFVFKNFNFFSYCFFFPTVCHWKSALALRKSKEWIWIASFKTHQDLHGSCPSEIKQPPWQLKSLCLLKYLTPFILHFQLSSEILWIDDTPKQVEPMCLNVSVYYNKITCQLFYNNTPPCFRIKCLNMGIHKSTR